MDGAHLKVLQMFFGTDRVRFGVTSSRFPGETRYFNRFSAPREEIVKARVWAGLHFRTADVQGAELGRKELHGESLLPTARLTKAARAAAVSQPPSRVANCQKGDK